MKALSELRLLLVSGLFALCTTACVFTLGDGTDNNGTQKDGWNNQNDSCGLHSNLNVATNACVCESGYSWCDPAIDGRTRFDCCAGSQLTPCHSGSNNHMNSQGQCYCLSGYDWCDKSADSKDLECCPITGNATPGTDPSAGAKHPDPNASCDPQKDYAWCSHDIKMGPEQSTYYECKDGKWIDQTAILDDLCRADGMDFAYGCMYDASNPQAPETRVVCGEGPGTSCNINTADACTEDKSGLLYCKYGRLTKDQCTPKNGDSCKTPDGQEFEFGVCGEQDGKLSCLCSDTDPNGTSTMDMNSGNTMSSTDMNSSMTMMP